MPFNLVEKYIASRLQGFRLLHQEDLNSFVNRWAPSMGNDPEAAAERYFEEFRERVRVTREDYVAQKARLEADEKLDVVRRDEAIRELNPPVFPAWMEEDDQRFIRTYLTDPRTKTFELHGQLAQLAETEVVQNVPMVGEVSRPKTPWEMREYQFLLWPRDGSVPLYPLDEEGMPIVPSPDIAELALRTAPIHVRNATRQGDRGAGGEVVGRQSLGENATPTTEQLTHKPPPAADQPMARPVQQPQPEEVDAFNLPGDPQPPATAEPPAGADLQADLADLEDLATQVDTQVVSQAPAPTGLVDVHGNELSTEQQERLQAYLNSHCRYCDNPRSKAGMPQHEVACARKHEMTYEKRGAVPEPATA